MTGDEDFMFLHQSDLLLPLHIDKNFTSTVKALDFSLIEKTANLLKSGKLDKTEITHELEILHSRLSKISTELLNRSPSEYESTPIAKEMRELEEAYKFQTENLMISMRKFLVSYRALRDEIIKSLKEFQLVSRVTAQVTLGTSITNTALVMGSLAHKLFNFSWHPKISLFTDIIAGLSFTASLLTISFMRRTTSDIAKDARKEIQFLRDLLITHRKGDYIDEKASSLFPHGIIDLNLIDTKVWEKRDSFPNRYAWKKYLCTVIILNNVSKDRRLLTDDKFLTTVKLFVENPAAEIWWNRIKVKKLLESVNQKIKNLSMKEFLSAHESHIYKTAQYIYPFILPWIVSSWKSEEMRFICNSIAGILAYMDLEKEKTEEPDELMKITQSFERDFREIKIVCETLDCSDD